jgi:hypothetical protein
MNHGPRG